MFAERLENILGTHLWPLILKETREILRNKYLLFLLLVPPTIQLLILGAALDPQVRNVSLGTVDHAQTQESRDLISSLTASGVFSANKDFSNERVLSQQLEKGKLDVGVVIPPDFTQDLNRHSPAQVQVLVDGADAYSAGITSAYILRIINQYTPATVEPLVSPIDPKIEMLYNPGQVSSWSFVPGILGACLTLTATLVASATILRERESGTMEQLLMTPSEAWEILLAKVIPLVIFLIADVCFAIAAARIIFGLPFRGSFPLFMLSSILYVFVGIGFGMLLGALCKSQRQAQLTSFFINIPLILLSGTVVPLDTMPPFLQTLSAIDPLRYYTLIARGIILKGATLAMLWQQVGLLAFFAILVFTVSINQFRRQLV